MAGLENNNQQQHHHVGSLRSHSDILVGSKMYRPLAMKPGRGRERNNPTGERRGTKFEHGGPLSRTRRSSSPI